MNDRQIQEVIAFLEEEVPRDQARVTLHQYGGGPDEGMMIGNRTGFLRLGLELLKAAYAPLEGTGGSTIKIDIGYLVTSDSTIQFDWFERRDPFDGPGESDSRTGRFLSWLFLGVLAAGVSLAIVGFFAVLHRLVG